VGNNFLQLEEKEAMRVLPGGTATSKKGATGEGSKEQINTIHQQVKKTGPQLKQGEK